ncbi:uncharacterized protein LOC134705707 [Mytilus trossulus]|uniref:uncharacterized protein LOC134705707 n=1 Tax=Mytilus trossulus TaxID=6551 RepID=UPI00300568BB
MAAAPNVCDGCTKDGKVESFCVNCEQLYCQECTVYHMKCKVTRSHILMDASNVDTYNAHSSIDVKCGNECGEQAVVLCLDCKQLLCNDCSEKHSMLKATKGHNTITAKQLVREETASLSSDCVYSEQTSVISHPQELVHAQVQVEKGPHSGTFLHEFMSSAPGDKELTRVRGIVLLFDGRIIIADYKNRSLKLFSREMKFEMAKDIKDDPRGMVASAYDNVIVTFADKKEIRIYEIENKKIRTKKKVNVKEKPYSIAYNKDHFAVEHGEGEDGTIRIYDQHIREIFIIPGSTRSFGQFTGNTIRLALDLSKYVIFVVDIAKELVHCVDFKGGLIWTVKVGSPRGIVFHNNMLFVASSTENKIIQMNAVDGIVYSMLDEDNRIRRPRYIAYNPDSKKMAVEIDGNHIKLYNITGLQKGFNF